MLLEEVDQMIRARRIKLEEIKRIADEDDINPALVEITNKLTANSSAVKIDPAHFEALFQEQLKKYDGYKRLVKEETATQEDLLMAIQETNKAFVASRKSNRVVQQREKALQNLETAYQKYKAILGNLKEGTKFHKDFEKFLARLRDNCRDYFFARKMEAKDYINEVTIGMSGMNLNLTQPHGVANSSPYEGATAPPPQHQPTHGAWDPSMGVRFGSEPVAQPPVQKPQLLQQLAPSQHQQQQPPPPQSFAQLQQQYQQKSPAVGVNVQQQSPQQQQQQQQQQAQNNEPPYPPNQNGGQQPSSGWDATKGIFFGGKGK
ncbi:pH-response regulator protein palA/rim20 [Entomortierella beljakovae]|nr:pH-response regulator protein palA/rim20 [Entomortierella beljakovae]